MYKRHHDVRTRRSEGTGGWLLETPEFQMWFENQVLEGFRVLLGLGDPGAGKTFIWYDWFCVCYVHLQHLSSFLIDYLRGILGRGRAALVYVYCDYRDKQNTCNMVGELAKQLLFQSSSIPDEVWALFEKDTKITTEIAQQIFTMLARRFESTYVCIDALDECEPEVRRNLLRILSTPREPPLHIFCTGRTSVEVEATELLGPLGTRIKEIYAHEEDLRRHIEAQIAQDRHKKAMDEQLLEEITEALLSRSQKL
jgi:hypothetical protein